MSGVRGSRRPDVKRRHLHEWFAACWERWGSLYVGGLDESEAEERELRDECERAGLPMGYGRVQREPLQLSDEQARAQFRVRRRP